MRTILDRESRTLMQMLRIAIGTSSESDFAVDDGVDWEGVLSISESQGVSGIAFEGIQKVLQTRTLEELGMSRHTKMHWISVTSDIESTYHRQFTAAGRMASLFASEGIRTFVLKGISMSTYYPVPAHREFCDLDCFLDGRYEDGNILAEREGYEVDRSFYKHSHIDTKDLLVENHQFCLPIRGSRRRKELEVVLERMLREAVPHRIDDTDMLLPPATFHAVFLTFHAASHFLAEGIVLRHILDWALFLAAEQNNVDWKQVYSCLDSIGHTHFCRIMTTLARDVFSVRIVNGQILVAPSSRTRGLLMDSLSCRSTLYSTGSLTFQRLHIVYNYLAGAWKYHRIFHRSAIAEIVRSTVALMIERKPKLR